MRSTSSAVAAAAAGSSVPVTAATAWITSPATFPNGAHVGEVEVDPETGVVEIVRYTVVDDVGTVINALTLEGQIHGGIGQGVGQAFSEHIVYDPDSGQLLTGSFMDYPMPRADTVPAMVIAHHSVPCRTNPLGVKGAGESGVAGSLPSVMNAVLHALSYAGVSALDMPFTSERVWQALQTAQAAQRRA